MAVSIKGGEQYEKDENRTGIHAGCCRYHGKTWHLKLLDMSMPMTIKTNMNLKGWLSPVMAFGGKLNMTIDVFGERHGDTSICGY